MYPTYSTGYAYPKQAKIQINGSILGSCLSFATAQYNGNVQLSRDEMNFPYDRSQFMVYLRANPRTFDYSTGTEAKLYNWIMSVPDNSIDPLSLYTHSLALNHGNIWNATLAIHQLLRNYARYDNPYYLNRAVTKNSSEALFNKLIDIRGDLSERGQGYKGDHAGSWYRLWGIMIYRMLLEKPTSDLVGSKCSLPSTPMSQKSLQILIDSFNDSRTSVEATLAEWVKPLLFVPEKDKRKGEINRVGGETAGALLDIISRPDVYSKVNRHAWQNCKDRDYLQSAK